MSKINQIKVGSRIKFLRDLWQGPTEEMPACEFANKGEEGEIVRIGTCWEGYMVKRDSWPAPFGCESKDFEVLN